LATPPSFAPPRGQAIVVFSHPFFRYCPLGLGKIFLWQAHPCSQLAVRLRKFRYQPLLFIAILVAVWWGVFAPSWVFKRLAQSSRAFFCRALLPRESFFPFPPPRAASCTPEFSAHFRTNVPDPPESFISCPQCSFLSRSRVFSHALILRSSHSFVLARSLDFSPFCPLFKMGMEAGSGIFSSRGHFPSPIWLIRPPPFFTLRRSMCAPQDGPFCLCADLHPQPSFRFFGVA